MARRRLSPEEQAAWQQLARSVNPLAGARTATPTQARADIGATDRQDPLEGSKTPKALIRASSPSVHSSVVRPSPVAVLDSSWERRIKRGVLRPEISIDLHGHSLALAHQHFDQAVAQALIEGVRVLLIITGKSRPPGISQGRPGRGAIRAEIGHWIDNSPFADMIASVRNAHPRHGGDGAIYVILRRKK